MASDLRYVVLHHVGWGEAHYDLMFETAPGSALAAWHSGDWPVTSQSILTPIADHRRKYLQYQGPISNNRGSVRRVAAGSHRIISDSISQLIVSIDPGQTLVLPRQPASG